jgi:hypothetical protein
MADLIDLLEDTILGTEDGAPKQTNQEVIVQENEKKESNVAPKPAVKKLARPKVPKMAPTLEQKLKKQATTVEEWFTDKSKFPANFTYTEEGNLQVPPVKPGDVASVIQLSRFQRATPEFTAEFYKTRAEESKKQEELYVKSKRDLNAVILLYKNGDATVDEVINANTQVAIEEYKMNAILKLPRKTESASKVAETSLTMNPYDKGKLADLVRYTTYSAFPARSLWMPAQEPEVVAPQPLPIRQTEENSNSNTSPPPSKKPLTAQQIAIIRAKMGKK